MKPLRIGPFQANIPIIQGGMGVGISLSGLATSVANQGGIGVISAAGVGLFEKKKEKDTYDEYPFEQEIIKTKKATKGIVGANIMVAMTNYKQLVKSALKAKVDIIFSGAGLPLDLPKLIQDQTHTKIVPIISSARAAKLITKRWLNKYNYLPDAFVIEGPKAGGHLGFKKEELNLDNNQLEEILHATKTILQPFEEQNGRSIPLIVGGGIYSGEDIDHFLSLGADGVQMATRFVTTEECDASDAFKQTYIDAKESDIRLISSPVGLPGRAIHNAYLTQVEEGKKHPFSCPFDCIITCKKEAAPYCISLALYNAKVGRLSHGFAFAGTNAYRATKIQTIKEVFDQIKDEYNQSQAKKE